MTAWRQGEQARNLSAVLPDGPLLVWCGWGHLSKSAPSGRESMAMHFQQLTGIEPFALDQTTTVHADGRLADWVERFRNELAAAGGTAGFLTDEAPDGWRQRWADAFLLSLDNELT